VDRQAKAKTHSPRLTCQMQSRLAIPNGNNHFPCSRAQDTGQLVPIFDHPDIEESPSTPAPRDIIHKPNDFARPALPNDVCNDGCMAAGAPNHHLLLPVRHEEFGAISWPVLPQDHVLRQP
jgi:hypothetical protein